MLILLAGTKIWKPYLVRLLRGDYLEEVSLNSSILMIETEMPTPVVAFSHIK